MSPGMETEDVKPEEAENRADSTWQTRLWQWVCDVEDAIDRMALRLGDAIFGAERCERIFGPHPAHATKH
jgi:hypothetical protein